MRRWSAWLYGAYEELGDVTPDEERGMDSKTESELEAEFAQGNECGGVAELRSNGLS